MQISTCDSPAWKNFRGSFPIALNLKLWMWPPRPGLDWAPSDFVDSCRVPHDHCCIPIVRHTVGTQGYLLGRSMIVSWPFLKYLFPCSSFFFFFLPLQLIFLNLEWSLSSLCCQSWPHTLAWAQMPLAYKNSYCFECPLTFLNSHSLCLLLSFSTYHIPPYGTVYWMCTLSLLLGHKLPWHR